MMMMMMVVVVVVAADSFVHLLFSRNHDKCLTCVASFNPHNNSMKKYRYYNHIANEKAEPPEVR